MTAIVARWIPLALVSTPVKDPLRCEMMSTSAPVVAGAGGSTRTNRAMAKRTGFGREMIAGQWAAAEFAALYRLWEVGQQLGVQVVPYPVQILGTELLLEFIGTPEGEAAPRLAQLRPEPDELA